MITIKLDSIADITKGDTPCVPNKLRGKVCDTCDEYAPVGKHILIIKLGAMGDVIRSTPLVVKFRKEYPDCHITWVTHTPELLSKDHINDIFGLNSKSIMVLLNTSFDLAVNLDKDKEACILLANIQASVKLGFTWNMNHIEAIGNPAKEKILTGMFDQYSMQTKKSYQQEMFEICGFRFSNESYLINLNQDLFNKWKCLKLKSNSKRIVGLNTGCGKRWHTRLWPSEHWTELIKLLWENNMYPILLGGPDEHEQNKDIALCSGTYYPGPFSLEEFVSIIANCDAIVTCVSMVMHVAIALQKPLILFNNIFNRNEFELYGRGTILEPENGCDCYYGNICTRDRPCMMDIAPETALDALIQQFK